MIFRVLRRGLFLNEIWWVIQIEWNLAQWNIRIQSISDPNLSGIGPVSESGRTNESRVPSYDGSHTFKPAAIPTQWSYGSHIALTYTLHIPLISIQISLDLNDSSNLIQNSPRRRTPKNWIFLKHFYKDFQ